MFPKLNQYFVAQILNIGNSSMINPRYEKYDISIKVFTSKDTPSTFEIDSSILDETVDAMK